MDVVRRSFFFVEFTIKTIAKINRLHRNATENQVNKNQQQITYEETRIVLKKRLKILAKVTAK